MKKHERLELLRQIVLENEIETQNDLVQKLEEKGLKATQATVSRDINRLGIIKVPGKSGKYVYGISKESARELMTPLQQACEYIVSLSDTTPGLEQFLCINVAPGNTRFLKRLILEEYADIIFGLVADDDTLMVIFKTPQQSEEVREDLVTWMSHYH